LRRTADSSWDDLCALQTVGGGTPLDSSCTSREVRLISWQRGSRVHGFSASPLSYTAMALRRKVSGNASHSFGWVPDLPDHRDHTFAAARRILRALPPRADLTSKMPVVYDQGQIGSCTANAIAAAVQFDRIRQGSEGFVPSRLFVYYNERVMEHTTHSDAGAMIRDGIKSVAKQGDCRETTWPYAQSNLFKKPSVKAYKEALLYQALEYQRVDRTLGQMKGCLAEGFPFVFGITVYTGFMSGTTAKNGAVGMPQKGETVEGGHAMLMIGYDDTAKRFIFRNSWGTGWGKKGYGTIPYAYLTDGNLADDFWTIRVVE
jgi:C1A family cysteine protease